MVILVALWMLQCPTTLDGLPLCEHKPMTAATCLHTFPPDLVGGFCEWYGHATKRQADTFERRRGLRRIGSEPWMSSYTLWSPVTPYARKVVACRMQVMRDWDSARSPTPDFINDLCVRFNEKSFPEIRQ